MGSYSRRAGGASYDENKSDLENCSGVVMESSSESSYESQASSESRTTNSSYNDNFQVSAIFNFDPPEGKPFDGVVNPFDVLHEKDIDEASVGEDDTGKNILPVADVHGNPVRFPGLEEQRKMASLRNLDVDSQKGAPRSVIVAGFESFKYIYSSVLLVFSLVLVMASIFTGQTVSTAQKGMSTVVVFVVFCLMLAWLAMMEGGQGCLVGLQPIDKNLYAETHPRTFDNTYLCHKGGNMGRLISGRQFLVVLVIYFSNLMFSVVSDIHIPGFHDGLLAVFLNSNAALVIVTIMIGQLVAQVNAASCMLDFINNYFMLYCVTYISLVVEFSGILHSVYLFEMIFSKIAGKPVENIFPQRTLVQRLFFWGRVLMSLVIFAFSFAVTLIALSGGYTSAWEGIRPSASVALFFFLTCFIGLMEGMQIALFTVVNLPEEELARHATAYGHCQLVFTEQNLQAFLIGRQICVTTCMFALAQITTLNVVIAEEDNIFGVSDGVQSLFNTGLLGALVTTIGASLLWRIIASSFPIIFLSNPVIVVIIHLCLVLEKSGLCSASWVLARCQKLLMSYQPDEVYLEGIEPHSFEPVTRRDHDIDRVVTVIRFALSLGLAVFSVLMITAAMFSEQTFATSEKGLHPALTFSIFWLFIILLAIMEGGQGCLVGLQPIEKESYRESHPRSFTVAELAHRENNMERFIVGRQFLVVLVIFLCNFIASSVDDASVLGLPDMVNEIFLTWRVGLILTIVILGQLTAQVNAASCLLDFTNNHLLLLVTYVSLAVEFTGILHSVYFFQWVFAKITGTPSETKIIQRTCIQSIFFWVRVGLSVMLLYYAFAVTLSALFEEKTTAWRGVSPAISTLIFVILICFVGMLEGMQIALFAVLKLPEGEIRLNSIAHANCKLAFNEQNLQALLIGRQICVTASMFVIARITTLDVDVGADNIFGVSDGIQECFNIGLLGAFITTTVASLAWRVIASAFPFLFLSNPLIYFIIRLCLIIETSGLCSAAWVFGRWNKLLVGFQPDSVYLEGAERHGTEPVSRRDKEVDVSIAVIKYCYSMGLLIFCVTIVMATIFSEQTRIAQDVHPAVAFVTISFLLVWLAIMEGGQGDLVGLQPIEKELYRESHPYTFRSTRIAHKGDNMERFIVGRQFLVVLVVFVSNLAGGAVSGSSVLGFSDTLNLFFVESGAALILMTIIIGQLTAQINAANCMLDFINTRLMVFTTYVSLAIEYSGLLHAVYLVQIIFSKITGVPVESKEQAPNGAQNVFFWGRVSFSIFVLAYAFAVTLSALFNGNTTMWDSIPSEASVAIFFVLMCFVGIMDGMQIALFAVVNLPDGELSRYSFANATCELVFKGTNLQAFLIGRQILVTICMFVIARITTVYVELGVEDNIFGVSDALQEFFNTGLLGTLITTIFGSLAWRIMASAFPVWFLSNPFVYVIVKVCLLLESSGICSSAWLLALVHQQVAGLQPDQYYLGSCSDEKRDLVDVELESSHSGSNSSIQSYHSSCSNSSAQSSHLASNSSAENRSFMHGHVEPSVSKDASNKNEPSITQVQQATVTDGEKENGVIYPLMQIFRTEPVEQEQTRTVTFLSPLPPRSPSLEPRSSDATPEPTLKKSSSESTMAASIESSARIRSADETVIEAPTSRGSRFFFEQPRIEFATERLIETTIEATNETSIETSIKATNTNTTNKMSVGAISNEIPTATTNETPIATTNEIYSVGTSIGTENNPTSTTIRSSRKQSPEPVIETSATHSMEPSIEVMTFRV